MGGETQPRAGHCGRRPDSRSGIHDDRHPVQRMGEAEGHKLKDMAVNLKREVIGQDEAIDKLVRSIQRGRVGLKDPNKPIGAFMFLGPYGSGQDVLG